jgi:CheY-like chemotaxis protein
MIQVLLVDDDPGNRDYLRELLHACCRGWKWPVKPGISRMQKH